MSLNELEQAAQDLPEDERLELAERIMAGIRMTPEIEAAWRAEAERRWQDLESGRVEGIPAEQVLSGIRKKLHDRRQVSYSGQS